MDKESLAAGYLYTDDPLESPWGYRPLRVVSEPPLLSDETIATLTQWVVGQSAVSVAVGAIGLSSDAVDFPSLFMMDGQHRINSLGNPFDEWLTVGQPPYYVINFDDLEWSYSPNIQFKLRQTLKRKVRPVTDSPSYCGASHRLFVLRC